MLIDKENEFSDAQAVTSTGANASTNVVDIVKAGDAADEPYLVVSVNTSPDSGGAATITVTLETDDNDSFSSATTVLTSATYDYDAIVAGDYVFRHRIPIGSLERYCRVVYTVATADLTAGKFDAFLTFDAHKYLGE